MWSHEPTKTNRRRGEPWNKLCSLQFWPFVWSVQTAQVCLAFDVTIHKFTTFPGSDNPKIHISPQTNKNRVRVASRFHDKSRSQFTDTLRPYVHSTTNAMFLDLMSLMTRSIGNATGHNQEICCQCTNTWKLSCCLKDILLNTKRRANNMAFWVRFV